VADHSRRGGHRRRRLEDGRHVAAAADVSELASLGGRNLVGTPIEVHGSPLRYRVPG
jgi:hypothetical protein